MGGARTWAGERVVARVLSEDDKLRRVVLKRVNLDQVGVRSDFLKSGTMARGAAETGKVRHPCHCALNPPSHPHATVGELLPGGTGRWPGLLAAGCWQWVPTPRHGQSSTLDCARVLIRAALYPAVGMRCVPPLRARQPPCGPTRLPCVREAGLVGSRAATQHTVFRAGPHL